MLDLFLYVLGHWNLTKKQNPNFLPPFLYADCFIVDFIFPFQSISQTGAWCQRISGSDSQQHKTDYKFAEALAGLIGAGATVGSFGDGPGLYKRHFDKNKSFKGILYSQSAWFYFSSFFHGTSENCHFSLFFFKKVLHYNVQEALWQEKELQIYIFAKCLISFFIIFQGKSEKCHFSLSHLKNCFFQKCSKLQCWQEQEL